MVVSDGDCAVRVTKAVITAASRKQRTLPVQNVVDRDGTQKSVEHIIVEEAPKTGNEEICMVVVRAGR